MIAKTYTMSSFNKFGLFFLAILCLSHNLTQTHSLSVNAKNQSSSSSYSSSYDDEYDDYYDDDSSKAATTTTATVASISKNFLIKTTKTLTTAVAILTKEFERELESKMNKQDGMESPQRSNHIVEPSCPRECFCTDDYKKIQCSNGRLTFVPTGIPSTALIIDLSNNQITKIRKDDFVNCSKVREINLSGNNIKEIENGAFSQNRRLQKLLLNNNQITTIDPETFSSAKDLDVLDLSNNSIVLPPTGSFLNQPDLLELFCRNCSWTELYDETFANLSNLNSLKMDGNDFNKKINAKAFEPMKNLIKLKLPELKQENIQELCNVLKSIDNISLKRFDISCYELVLGTSFNESLIFPTISTTQKAPPIDKKKEEEEKINLKKDTEIEKNFTKTEQHSPAVKKKASSQSSSSSSTSIMTDDKSSGTVSNLTLAIGQNESSTGGNDTIAENGILLAGTGITTSISSDNNKMIETEKAYQVPVSPELINYMLISIMILAIIGIIIGFICRKDYGGIKTKCCRTRKPTPQDRIRPGEDIPLNKISLDREQV